MKKSRPPETGLQINVRLQAADLAALDAWRKDQPDLPTRPEALRRLASAALNSTGDQPGLEELLRAFLEEGGRDRMDRFNYEECETVDQAILSEFHAKKGGGEFGALKSKARSILQFGPFDEEDGPATRALDALMRRIAK